MFKEVSLEIRSRNDLQAAARMNGATLTVADCRPLDREGMTMLLKVAGTRKAVGITVTTIRKMKGVRQAYEGESGDGGTRVLLVLKKPGVCRASSGSAVLCLDCPFNSTEIPAKWRLVAREADDVRRIMASLGEEGIEAKVKDVSPLDRKATLTDREKEIVRTAIAMGYFDFPRRISLRSLSKLVDVKPLVLSKVLRDME
jgi:hypothetical protein